MNTRRKQLGKSFRPQAEVDELEAFLAAFCGDDDEEQIFVSEEELAQAALDFPMSDVCSKTNEHTPHDHQGTN